MTPTELRQHLETLDLTQKGLARILLCDDRNIRRMANGSKPITRRVEQFLNAWIRERSL